MKRLNLAILDDYQHVALKMADWSKSLNVSNRCYRQAAEGYR
jgi:hypothetical protein